MVGLQARVISQAPLGETTLGARPGCHKGTPATRSHFPPQASTGQLLAVLPYHPGLRQASQPKQQASTSAHQAHNGLSREVMHGCLDLPLRQGRLAALKAASKRISVPGAQWAQQGSHAWLLRLTTKPGSPGSTSSMVADCFVHRQHQGRDTACCADWQQGQAYPPLGGAA